MCGSDVGSAVHSAQEPLPVPTTTDEEERPVERELEGASGETDSFDEEMELLRCQAAIGCMIFCTDTDHSRDPSTQTQTNDTPHPHTHRPTQTPTEPHRPSLAHAPKHTDTHTQTS